MAFVEEKVYLELKKSFEECQNLLKKSMVREEKIERRLKNTSVARKLNKENKNLSYAKLKSIHDMLNAYTVEERIDVLGLKPDRADVIVHASKIFTTIMKTADIDDIFVPQIGLSDGVIHDLYEKYSAK